MIIDFKKLKRFLIAGILIGLQGCASTSMSQYFEKPYFASGPAQMTQADREIFDRALFRQTNNRIQPAIKVWNEFLDKHPKSFEAHNNLGLVYFEDDQVDAAIAELETAMSLEPTELKIKNNLIRVLKFKSTLYKEARDYNKAVDTLRRVQEMSPPDKKEKIGFRIEGYEDKAFEQTKRINTLYAYEGFLKRYPDSSKNSDEARRKIKELKSIDTVSPVENSITEDQTPLEASAEVPLAKMGNEGTDAENPMLEGSLMGEKDKENMEEAPSTMKEVSEKKMESNISGEKASSDVGDLDQGFIPVQPLEVPRSAEQNIEIATQPEPKPATGIDLFPSPEPEASSPEPEISQEEREISIPIPNKVDIPKLVTPPEVAQVPQKKVKIVTRKNPLRVREDPNLNARILATLAKGSLVPFIIEENGWYKVEFSTGKMGWISKKYSQLVE